MNIAERNIRPAPSSDLRQRVEALAPWFHNMDLGGVWTAPDHFLGDYPAQKFRHFAADIPADLSGKSVLDIGCNAGFYSMEMARRGAERVVGIDSDERYLAQAQLAAQTLGFSDKVELRKLDVYDVAQLGERFDLVIFMGVLYHLRHPLLALDLIHEHVASDMLLFQSMLRGSGDLLALEQDYAFFDEAPFDDPAYPKLHFVERRFAGDWSNWWIPNRACAEAMLRAAGFAVEKRIEEEVYLCRRADRPFAEHGAGPVYPARGEGL
jgi:tRNA (mo5U34)-methyltransferase